MGFLALTAACGRGEPASEGAGRAAAPRRPSPEAAALAAWRGPVAFGIPLYPDAVEATDLHASMRAAWVASGEREALFPLRFGERVFVTDAPFTKVRAFYLPFVRRVTMDHAIDAASGHPVERHRHGGLAQDLFTAVAVAPDKSLVKLTISRPFYRYPDRRRIDRTVIQTGRVGTAP